eukprot:155595_1
MQERLKYRMTDIIRVMMNFFQCIPLELPSYTLIQKKQIEPWKRKLKINSKIDLYDDKAYSKWYTGQVSEINQGSQKFKVTYDGYNSSYDKYIPMDSKRIAPLHTHTSK